jgi:DNA-binding CsgD family transcriptional regulator
MKLVLEELNLSVSHSQLRLRTYFDDERVNILAETAVAQLSAWVIGSTSLPHNLGAAAALETDDKPTLESLLDRIPGNIVVALADKAPGERYLPGNRETSVLSRVNQMLRDDQPFEAKDEELYRGRLRKHRRGTEFSDAEESFSKDHIGLDDLAESPAQDFTLREEARLDVNRLVNQANLSPREGQVLELQLMDYSEKEIAADLKIKEATVSPLKFTAKKKLRKAAGLK